MPSENNKVVFVYGTLKKGFGNHGLLRDSEPLGEAVLKNFTLYDSGFPVATPEPKSSVTGELYRVSGETLARLDRLEGYNGPGARNMYDRVTITTSEGVEADVYQGNPRSWLFTTMTKVASDNDVYTFKGRW